MKNYYKYLFTIIYLLLIPHFVKYLLFIPNLFLAPFKFSGTGLDLVSIIVLILLGAFIYFIYKSFSSIIEGIYTKDNKKVVLKIIILLLVTAPIIFLFKDL